MDKRTIRDYLNGISDYLIEGKIISAYKQLQFVLINLENEKETGEEK